LATSEAVPRVFLAGTHPQHHITAGATEEIKLDGYRALAVKSVNGVMLFSRRRKSLNRQFPYIVEALADLPAGTVVDGEVLAIDESGRFDFNLLQHFRAESSRIQYYIFDLLCSKDRDLTRLAD
jgi:ATP-dependent DNA ligase